MVEAHRKTAATTSRANHADPAFNAPICVNLFEHEEGEEGSSLVRGGREYGLRRLLQQPGRLEQARLRKNDKRVSAVPPMQTAPRQAKSSRQASDGTPICESANTRLYPATAAGTANAVAIAMRATKDRVMAKAV